MATKTTKSKRFQFLDKFIGVFNTKTTNTYDSGEAEIEFRSFFDDNTKLSPGGCKTWACVVYLEV